MTQYKLSHKDGAEILTANSLAEFNKKVSASGISCENRYSLTLKDPGHEDITVDATLAVRRLLRGQE